MNKQEAAWKRFEETGCICDYLNYKLSICSKSTEGDLQNADCDRRNCSENKNSR